MIKYNSDNCYAPNFHLQNYDEKTGENTVKMHCGIVDTVGLIKKAIQDEYLRSPVNKHLRMRLVRTGSIVPDETPLCDILARTTAAWNVDFLLESSDPSRLPICTFYDFRDYYIHLHISLFFSH